MDTEPNQGGAISTSMAGSSGIFVYKSFDSAFEIFLLYIFLNMRDGQMELTVKKSMDLKYNTTEPKWKVLAMLKYMFNYGRKILNMHINILLKIVLNSDI